MLNSFLKKLYSVRFLFCISLKIILLIILFSGINSAQNTRASYKILGIAVEGNKTTDANTIIASSGLKIGDEIQIPGDQTLNAIRKLYALNIFYDIQISIDKRVADGVFLIIKIQEYPRVERVVIEGNDEIDTEDIEKKISFTRGTILKAQEISNLKLSVLKLYEEEGYLNAKINILKYNYYTADTTDEAINVVWRNEKDLSDEYTLEYEMDEITYSNLIARIKDRILLKMEIEENDQIVVREIEFRGNQAFDDGDLEGEMEEIEEAVWWKFWSSAQFDKKKYEEDKKKIIQYYRKNGYRDAEITSDSLVYSNDNTDLKIIMNVSEGAQYKVRNIEWSGNTIYPEALLNERLDFKKGDIFNYEKYEQNLRGNERQNSVSDLYLDNGYLTFNLRPSEIKVAEDSVDLHIRLEERNQFRVGKVEINGNDKTKDKVIRRELYTVPGDYYNKAFLLRSVQQLANLQYFNVEKLYGPGGIEHNLPNDSTVNITFKVEEKSSDYLNASVGYSGSWGFSGAIGVTLTNFSIAEPFSLGGGQIMSFNWQFGVGNLYRTFTIGFTEPWLFDTPTLVGLELFDTRQAYGYDLRQSGGTARVGRRLKWPDDFFYVQGFFRFQYNNVLEGLSVIPEGLYRQYTVGGTISRKDIDNPIFPSKGSSLVLDGEISGGPILPGEVDYFKLGFKSEWYTRLFNTNRIALYTSADFGYIEELKRGTIIPPYENFYMGGNGLIIATTPLRGYDDQEVGPRNSSGFNVGGNVMTKYTTELRFAVALEPIPVYVLAFAEAGNVYSNFNDADFFDLRRSVGFGARLLINPIGLIGFDLGYGFDRKLVDGNDPTWLFHFQFGRGF